jgi:hypothetical protein
VDFPRSRYWPIGRRIALVMIALFVGYRSYGDAIVKWFLDRGPANDIQITESEFQPAPPGERPLWFIRLRNTSDSTTYGQILIEATYLDASGETIEIDRIVLDQRLDPGGEQLIGSRDARPRDGAARGILRIIGAEVLE